MILSTPRKRSRDVEDDLDLAYQPLGKVVAVSSRGEPQLISLAEDPTVRQRQRDLKSWRTAMEYLT